MTREEIKQICQIYDNLRAERNAATIAYNSDDTFWEHVLATYKLCQPSIHSDIDKAAEEYAYKTTWDHGVRFDSFKAGAEWMSKQGFSFEDEVIFCGSTPLLKDADFDILEAQESFKSGDKVIVQIRKK